MNLHSAMLPDMAAILVLYEAQQDVHVIVDQLASAVGHVIVVDNAPAGRTKLNDGAADPRATVLRNGNSGGLAGAYNMALRHVFENLPQVAYVVFVDDDTDCRSLAAFARAEVTRAVLNAASTAAIAPAYRDRATGLRGAHVCLSRFRMTRLPRDFAGVRKVSFLINSMSIWNVAALRQIGAYNEELAVDHVDTEYCVRARRHGLDLYLNGDFEFPHAIGQRRSYRLLGKVLQSGGHSPARREMIGRNTTWLARRYAMQWPAFAMLCVLRLAYEAAGIVMVEDQKVPKLQRLFAGIMQGLFATAASGVRSDRWQAH